MPKLHRALNNDDPSLLGLSVYWVDADFGNRRVPLDRGPRIDYDVPADDPEFFQWSLEGNRRKVKG